MKEAILVLDMTRDSIAPEARAVEKRKAILPHTAEFLRRGRASVPLFGDLAAMRDAIARLGGDPKSVNPAIPVDLIVDHAVAVDEHATPTAASRNLALELKRNAERYSFLRWAAQAFDNLRLIPPGNGILHQINLEYLARVGLGARQPRLSGHAARDGQPHGDDQQPRRARLGRGRA